MEVIYPTIFSDNSLHLDKIMSGQINSRTSITCPYFGLIDDPKTNTDFPYVGNACHKIKTPVTIDLAYQENCCLKGSHTQCPGYMNGWEKGFPRSLRGNGAVRLQVFWRQWYWLLIIGAIFIFLLASYISIFPLSGLNFMSDVKDWLNPTITPSGTMPPTRTATSTITLTSTMEPTETASPTPTKTSTITQTPTETSTVTQTKRPYVPPTNTAQPRPQPTNPPPTATSRSNPPNPQPTDPPPPTNTPGHKP